MRTYSKRRGKVEIGVLRGSSLGRYFPGTNEHEIVTSRGHAIPTPSIIFSSHGNLLAAAANGWQKLNDGRWSRVIVVCKIVINIR